PTNLAEIAPHGTVRVEGYVEPTAPPATQESGNYYPRYYYYGDTTPPEESALWSTVSQLNARRGRRMESLAASGNFAIIYAETDKAGSATKLVKAQALERHWQFVRALVELRTGN